MEVSNIVKISNGLCDFSPDGSMIASVANHRLSIRSSSDLNLIHTFTCEESINFIQWSPDSQLILCGIRKSSLIQVFKIDDTDWKCKIDEGSVGLVEAQWSPDSRNILSTSEFHLKITVWSLVNKSLYYIKHPKQCSQYLDFSKEGKYMAVAEWRNCRDIISIYKCQDWTQVAHFPPATEDLEGVAWSPVCLVVCVWDSPIKYNVMIYSMHGECLSTYSAYQDALSIRSVSWSSSGQLLAISSYDGCMRMLNNVTWKVSVVWSNDTEHINPATTVCREVSIRKDSLFLNKTSSRYEKVSCTQNLKLPLHKHNDQTPLKTQNTIDSFSIDCRYFVATNHLHPTCLFIWSLVDMKLVSILIHLKAVKTVSWHPQACKLSITTGDNHHFLWSPQEARVSGVAEKMDVGVSKWQPKHGRLLALYNNNQLFLDLN